jgi:lipopolysaccharide/colanic/teichoic acid biosynthesis glycosyltransferase
MCEDAERLTGPVWAVDNDPRIIRVGRFLRKSRIDELPRLINVLCGEMSMVGARPIRRSFARQLAELIPFYDLRFVEKAASRPGRRSGIGTRHH